MIERKRVSIDLGAKDGNHGRTVQSEAPACDINAMMAKYQKTGVIPQSQRKPQYGDFSNVMDFMTAKTIVNNATQWFDTLPPLIRKRFRNDPAEYLEFMGIEENRAEAEELGLVERPAKEPAIETPPEEPPASEESSE